MMEQDLAKWFLGQGALGVMLFVSIGFNWFLVKTVVSVIKENTATLFGLKAIIENMSRKT